MSALLQEGTIPSKQGEALKEMQAGIVEKNDEIDLICPLISESYPPPLKVWRSRPT